jgi:hypothetical protein
VFHEIVFWSAVIYQRKKEQTRFWRNKERRSGWVHFQVYILSIVLHLTFLKRSDGDHFTTE